MLLLILIIAISANFVEMPKDSFDFRLYGGTITFVVVLIAWICLWKDFFKLEPKVPKVNLADRYIDLPDEELNVFNIKSEQFKYMIYVNFQNIHNAFMEYDYDMLKNYLTNDLYNYYFEQLELLKRKKYKNIYRDYELLNVKIFKVTNEHNMLMVNVYLNVRMFDYIVNVDTGRCVNGNAERKVDYEFELFFVKKGEEKFLLSKKECVNDMLADRSDIKKDK